jgi:transcription-repair coupling factor (superfamily II helicase)
MRSAVFRGILSLVRETLSLDVAGTGAARRGAPLVLGPSDTAASLVIAALLTEPHTAIQHALVVTPHQEAATRAADDLRSLLAGFDIDVWVYEHEAAARDRLRCLDALAGLRSSVVVAGVGAAIHPHPAAEQLGAATRVLRPGDVAPRDRLVAALTDGGYERVGLVANAGEFSVRGGIVDVFPPDADAPVRLELWGDDVDSIRSFDPLSQRALESLAEIVLRPVRLEAAAGDAVPLSAYLGPSDLLVVVEPAEAEVAARLLAERAGREDTATPHTWAALLEAASPDARPPNWGRPDGRRPDGRRPDGRRPDGRRPDGRSVRLIGIAAARVPEGRWREVRLPVIGVDAHGGQTHLLAQMLTGLAEEGLRVVIASAQAATLSGILRDASVDVALLERLDAAPAPGAVVAVPAPLARGFRIDAVGIAVVTDAEVIGWRRRRPRMRFLRDGERLSSWSDLSPDDLVVHLHHGIGRFRGLVQMAMNGEEREYLHLEYAQGDTLYVPTDQIGLVQRYIGAEGEQPKIHRLGGADWDREKRRVREATREMAAALLTLYAARASAPGHAFAPDGPWQREMEAAFPFRETPHQLQAIEDVKRDMESPKPMDRLVAGDVGYGKTEIALRASFKAVMDGKQVAVVVPTTVLAQQHYNVFGERFARFPVAVELVSRFRGAAETKEILNRVAAGQVDVLIGTHRVLGRDVKFRDLGLVIIDEEQRFGVGHKEHLKQLRKTVDVLTLTATPIPRTLHMSLAGLRDMTVMETPPEARLPIVTEIRPEDDVLIREAILRERLRRGQVYVVHNRVETIARAARRIKQLVPEARVGVAHGQMPEDRLEAVMLDFLGGRYDVLVCTTIVEIGLDIPTVNTIIIQDAHLMGLAQLYQLRGRVGRADRQAYCYLLYPLAAKLTPEAEERLRAMAEFVELGSGMGLAMRDLEIRGAGNILGPEQHGHVAAVGFDLYCRLLDEAIRESRGEIVEEQRDPTLELGVRALLPDGYVSDDHERMTYYRRLALARTAGDVDAIAAELAAHAGPLPEEARALVDVIRLRIVARAAGVTSIVRQDGRFSIRFDGPPFDDAVQRMLRAHLRGRVQVTPGGISVRLTEKAFADQAAALGDLIGHVNRLVARSDARNDASGVEGRGRDDAAVVEAEPAR